MNDFTNIKLRDILYENQAGNTKLDTMLQAFYGFRINVNPYYNYLTREGKTHYVENVYTLAIGATAYIVLDTKATTKEVVAMPTVWGSSAGCVLVTLGSCESYTDGALIIPINRNFNFNGAQTKYIYNPTPVNTSFPSHPTILIGSSSSNQSSGGGSNMGIKDEIIIIENGINYVFKIQNMSGEQIYLYSKIMWFEV